MDHEGVFWCAVGGNRLSQEKVIAAMLGRRKFSLESHPYRGDRNQFKVETLLFVKLSKCLLQGRVG